ncbi:hypothetical protein [Fictibacillus halophilus]|uniref:hypothetical protein n=1 Tax=Fictibacillus halophilus TaxID=1610490 RepID=UPI001CF96B72|nr:hypothetical protein [Fictibacillus halophilus]
MKTGLKILGFFLFTVSVISANYLIFDNVKTNIGWSESFFILTMIVFFMYIGWCLMTRFRIKTAIFFGFVLFYHLGMQFILFYTHRDVNFSDVWYFQGDYDMIFVAYIMIIVGLILYAFLNEVFAKGPGSVKISKWFIVTPAVLGQLFFYLGGKDFTYLDQTGYHSFTSFSEKHLAWEDVERIEFDGENDIHKKGDSFRWLYTLFPEKGEYIEIYMDSLEMKDTLLLNEKFLAMDHLDYFVVRTADNEYRLLKETKDYLTKKDYQALINLLQPDKEKLK